ncbi:agmatine deiminase family protein [soil metagenome]
MKSNVMSDTKYRMPAEWEPHAATLLAWPHRLSDWPGKFATVPWVYGEIVRTLTRYEPVTLVVRDAAHKAAAKRVLEAVHADLKNVTFITLPTDRGWVRDSGPIIVWDSKDKRVALDWHFNAWAKYDDWKQDAKLPAAVAKQMKVPTDQPKWHGQRVVLEGGSIDVNGAGLMLTTEECLLSKIQERNPGCDRADYETIFKTYLGIDKVLWLNRGIAGDDTHGHIDDLARFVNKNTIVTVVDDDERDENYLPLRENLERLQTTKLNIVPLPMPTPMIFRGQRIPASYANFYIANGVVIVPTFNDKNDRIAMGILAEQFPGRDIIGIHCVDLVWGLGTLHCMTQQFPA